VQGGSGYTVSNLAVASVSLFDTASTPPKPVVTIQALDSGATPITDSGMLRISLNHAVNYWTTVYLWPTLPDAAGSPWPYDFRGFTQYGEVGRGWGGQSDSLRLNSAKR
jgi:hypothetical protein